MTLAAFSQIQSLIATLNEHIRISPHAEMCAVAVSVKDPAASTADLMSSVLSVCDDCHGKEGTSSGGMKAQQQSQRAKQQIVMHEDEDGYCELVEVTGRDRRRRSSSINKAPSPAALEAVAVALNGGGDQTVDDSEAGVVATEEEPDIDVLTEEEQLRLMGPGGDSYYRSAMRLKEQLLSSTQTVPLSLIAANVLALNQTITKLLVRRGISEEYNWNRI